MVAFATFHEIVEDEESRSKKNYDVVKRRDEERERKPLKKRRIIPPFYDVILSDFLRIQILSKLPVKCAY